MAATLVSLGGLFACDTDRGERRLLEQIAEANAKRPTKTSVAPIGSTGSSESGRTRLARLTKCAPPRGMVVKQGPEGVWLEWTDAPQLPRHARLPMNHPPVVSIAQAREMHDDDPIIGVRWGQALRGYPWFVMSSGHMANDEIDGEPVWVTLCEACAGASAFRAKVNGRTLDFRLKGIRNGTWFAEDYQTRSYWHPFTGRAWRGPLAGTELERIPHFQTPWRRWKREFPGSSVIVASPEHRARPHATHDGDAKHPGDARQPGLALQDGCLNGFKEASALSQLKQSTLLFGAIPAEGETPIAFPLRSIQSAGGVLNLGLSGRRLALVVRDDFEVHGFWLPEGVEALEVEPGTPLRLKSAPQGNRAAARWDAWGAPLDTQSAAPALERVNGYMARWAEWVRGFPETEVHGLP